MSISWKAAAPKNKDETVKTWLWVNSFNAYILNFFKKIFFHFQFLFHF